MLDQERELSAMTVKELINPRFEPRPILAETPPSSSSSRVSFDPNPQIKEILPRKKKVLLAPSEWKYRTKNTTLFISKEGVKDYRAIIKKKAKRHIAMVDEKTQVLLKYKNVKDMEADMRFLGLKMTSYVENKLIVNGIGFRETEETVSAFFSKFGAVEKVVLEKNSKGFCTGKGTVTFTDCVKTSQEFRLNGRLLRIERIRKQKVNTVRLHISHMSKGINISRLRSILKQNKFVPENIRIDLSNGKNKGYGFVEFKKPEEAQRFMAEFASMRPQIGPDSFVEFSREKDMR